MKGRQTGLTLALTCASLLLIAPTAEAAKPKVSVADVIVNEGSAATSTATFPVTLSRKPKQKVSVSYATADAEATAASDYTQKTGVVRFKKRRTTANVTVSVTGDTLDEPDEDFTLTLSNPKNAKLGDRTATGTITDDDLSGIALARASADGATSVPIENVTVTYVKPEVSTEPAGFFVQKDAAGPALYVNVPPASLTPQPASGDTVSFEITQMGTSAGQRRATAIGSFSRSATGADVAALSQGVSSASDLVSSLDSYESELVDFAATLGDSSSAGPGYTKYLASTAAISGNPSLTFRVPTTVAEAFDLQPACTVNAQDVPLWRSNSEAQLSAWRTEDIEATCPAPRMVGASAPSASAVNVSFDRKIASSSLASDGSQFSIPGLTITGASLSGAKNVLLTTSSQTPAQPYTVTVDGTLEDLAGSPVDPSFRSQPFAGYAPAAALLINEVAPAVTGNADLVELRATNTGTTSGFELIRGNFSSNRILLATLPDLLVEPGDLVVVHLNPGAGVSTEQSSKTSCADPACFPGAFDVRGGTTSIVFSDAVLHVRNPQAAAPVDSVPFTVPGGANPVAFPTEVGDAQTLGAWLPANCGGSSCSYTSTPTVEEISVNWSGASGSNTIARKPIADTNQASDWYPSASAQTLGSPNP